MIINYIFILILRFFGFRILSSLLRVPKNRVKKLRWRDYWRVVASWKPELAISWEKSIRKFVVPRKYQSNFTQEICITLINFYPYSLSLWAWKVFELNLIEFFHPHIIQFTEGSEFSTISHDITFFSHFTHPSQLVDIFSPNENLLFENRSHNTLFLFFLPSLWIVCHLPLSDCG